MNDLMKSSELTQLLLQHSIMALNPGIIKPDPREDDSVFGGVWVQPEEETKKNTLSLTGTEIWGPKPQLPGEKSGNSTNSSGKSTSSDVTPEIVPGKRDKFLFGNTATNQDFMNNFPAYSHFNDNVNSFGLISPSADIPLNQNLSNNVQRRSDMSMMTDEKHKSLGPVWNNGNNKHPGSMEVFENLAQAIGEWNQQSTLAPNNLCMLQKTTDVSSLEKLPEFCPNFGLQKDSEKNVSCYAPCMPTPPWGAPGMKQPSHGSIGNSWMKKGSADSNLASMPLSKTNQNPQCFSPWDQTGKSFFPNMEDAWGGNSLENQMLASQQNKLLTNLNNSAAVMKDLSRPIKFDPSVPPPPLPGFSSFSDLQLLAASTSLPPEQLLNLLKSNSNHQAQLKAQHLNLTKSNFASSLKPQLSAGRPMPSNIPGYGVQCSSSPAQHPWASEQRVNDIKLAVLYRKLARQLFPGQQALHTRSKKLQQLISLGFKREEAGKVLMDNDLDFELTLGELVFKTAISRGLIEDPFKPSGGLSLPTQYLDINFLKGVPGANKHGETFQNYLNSLELLIQKQQQMLIQNNPRYSSPSQPQIDYTIQALLNSQPNPPLSTFLPNLSFTNTNHPPYIGNTRFQPSLFDSPGSLTPSSPFLSSQSCSISNLNPQSPEWVPGSNPIEGNVASGAAETRPVSDGSLEVATILGHLKLSSQRSCSKDSPFSASSQPWSSGKVFSAASVPETAKSAFSIPDQSSSALSIKEFIPGVPWNKDASLNASRSSEAAALGQRSFGSFGHYSGSMDDSGYTREHRQSRDLSGTNIWMSGLDGSSCKEGSDWMLDKKRGGAFYSPSYGLNSADNEEGTVAFNGCHSGDDGGYGESLDGSSPSFQSNWIVIKNIPDNISEEMMSSALIVYGSIKSMTFMKETRSVLVCYESKQDAIEAKNGFDYSESDEMPLAKMSAEFVPDWTMSLSSSDSKDGGYDKPFYADKDYQEGGEALIEDGSDVSSPLADMGYTTPGGLWIPSKVLQNLEFCSRDEEANDGIDGLLLDDEENEEQQEEEEEEEEEEDGDEVPGFGCKLQD